MQGDISNTSNITAAIDGQGMLDGRIDAAEGISGSLSEDIVIDGEISAHAGIDGELAAAAELAGTIDIPSTVDGDPYQGEYSVTPSGDVQILPTYGKVMHQNVTINPIPNNYGLITWNGSTLTVS